MQVFTPTVIATLHAQSNTDDQIDVHLPPIVQLCKAIYKRDLDLLKILIDTFKTFQLTDEERYFIFLIESLLENNTRLHISLLQTDFAHYSLLLAAQIKHPQYLVFIKETMPTWFYSPMHFSPTYPLLIHWASFTGEEWVINWLLSHHVVHVDSKDGLDRTALMIAAEEGHIMILRSLRSAGAFPHATEARFGWTALLFAASAGRLNAVQFLLSPDGGSSINERDNDGVNVYMLAARYGYTAEHITLLKWLYTNYNECTLLLDEDGRSAFLHAAEGGFIKAVECLLQLHGTALLRHHDKKRVNALTIAAYKGHVELIRWLVDVIKIDITQPENAPYNVLTGLSHALQAQSERADIYGCLHYVLGCASAQPKAHTMIPFDIDELLPDGYPLPPKARIANDLYQAIKAKNWEAIDILVPQLDSRYVHKPGREDITLLQYLQSLGAERPEQVATWVTLLKRKVNRSEYLLNQLQQPLTTKPAQLLFTPHKSDAPYLYKKLK